MLVAKLLAVDFREDLVAIRKYQKFLKQLLMFIQRLISHLSTSKVSYIEIKDTWFNFNYLFVEMKINIFVDATLNWFNVQNQTKDKR